MSVDDEPPPGYFDRLMVSDRDRPALEPMPKPCHDCAVVWGMYAPITNALSRQPEHVQAAVSERWYCHNNPHRACRGNIDALTELRAKAPRS